MADHDALLHARWRAAVTGTCSCSPSDADDALDALLNRHREPHRRYHGEAHVAHVLDAVHDLVDDERESVSLSPGDEHVIMLAAAFHDAIYDPRSSTNEADSADLAERVLTDLGASADIIDGVRTMILATAHHLDSALPVDHAVAVLLDADLAVLGAAPGGYQAYVDGIRFEYGHLDDATWATGRRRVVEALLARDPLFVTDAGRRRWDARARANLTAERRQLLTRTSPSA